MAAKQCWYPYSGTTTDLINHWTCVSTFPSTWLTNWLWHANHDTPCTLLEAQNKDIDAVFQAELTRSLVLSVMRTANCQWLSRYKNSTVFQECIFIPMILPFKCPYLPMRIPIPCTTCDVIGLNGHRLFWHLQLEQEKEIFHEHEWGKQAREKMRFELLRLTRKNIDFLPIHILCTFYWKLLIHNPYNFCSKLFRLSGSPACKKAVSDSPGLVDFAIELVNSVFNLPYGQVMLFEEFEYQKNCENNSASQKVFGASWNDVWASKRWLQLAQMASCKIDFLCTLEPSNNLLPSPTKTNEERIAKELERRTKWNVKVSTFCLLAVPELQKLIFNIRKCLTYKQCSALGCFGSFWPDNDQKMHPPPGANKLGPMHFKAKLLHYLLVLFILFAVGLQALGPVMNLCSTSQLQALFLHSLW